MIEWQIVVTKIFHVLDSRREYIHAQELLQKMREFPFLSHSSWRNFESNICCSEKMNLSADWELSL